MKYNAFLAASVFSLVAYHSTSLAQQQDELAIGAWNIEWLGNVKPAARPAQAPDDIAAYIAHAKVDVLALSEISITRSEDGAPVNRQLDEAFALLNSRGASWEYKLFEKHPKASSPKDQWTGLAWNKQRVQLSGGPWSVAGMDEQRRVELLGERSRAVPLNRTPYAVKLSAGAGKSDFLLVPLHLKANTGKNSEAQRVLELHLILKGLDDVRAEHADDDLILLGDTNMLSTTEPGAQLLRDYGMRDCNSADLNTWLTTDPAYLDAPFDRIFVMRGQPETAQTCVVPDAGGLPFEIVTPDSWVAGMTPQAFRQRLSDHQMVKTTVRIGVDDD
ncbi:endonuclease/exonuclease/phosphatase family protein [Pseudomonas sp. KnCO4]|uniref:endonuclease/exonuclease/phosphatase family protein n=1 Tax=Pseudomonas sp. KnCO4 TaxID=3381355 RepID=UPI003877B833